VLLSDVAVAWDGVGGFIIIGVDIGVAFMDCVVSVRLGCWWMGVMGVWFADLGASFF